MLSQAYVLMVPISYACAALGALVYNTLRNDPDQVRAMPDHSGSAVGKHSHRQESFREQLEASTAISYISISISSQLRPGCICAHDDELTGLASPHLPPAEHDEVLRG